MTGLSVALGLWQDRPPTDALVTAWLADELGFTQLWIGEMATYDAFALATAVGLRTSRIGLTIGPLAVGVRDPVTIAMGAASVSDLTGRRVAVALGSSSPVVVEQWHGRSRLRPARMLAETACAVRTLLDGGRVALDGEVVRATGYRLRLPPVPGPLTVAAFGHAAVRVAARHADRLVVALVTPASAGRLVAELGVAAQRAQRGRPSTAAWVPVAVTREPRAAVAQVRRMLAGYFAAPGYADMFTEAGFGHVVAQATAGTPAKDLLAVIPDAAVAAVAAIGAPEVVEARLGAYAEHVDEVVALVCCTDDDPVGETTLRHLASWTAP
ncbi:MAG TPA: LLM class F420-dependent oxidoreductase [Pseudonocardia sp.]